MKDCWVLGNSCVGRAREGRQTIGELSTKRQWQSAPSEGGTQMELHVEKTADRNQRAVECGPQQQQYTG